MSLWGPSRRLGGRRSRRLGLGALIAALIVASGACDSPGAEGPPLDDTAGGSVGADTLGSDGVAASDGVSASDTLGVGVSDGALAPDTGAPWEDTGSPADTGSLADTTAAEDTTTPADTGSPADTSSPADTTTPADTTSPADTTTPADTTAPGPAPRELIFCLTGAPSRGEPSNQPFNALCDDPDLVGVVQSCDGGQCYGTFDSFFIDVDTSIYPALFEALDDNHDDFYDEDDSPTRITLLGYSWGGLASVQLAATFLSDPRVAASRATVQRLLVMDPFQPGQRLDVPAGVERFWEFRHSIASSGDCSSGAPLGPYLGLQPHCEPSSVCEDYDYSLDPSTWFPALGGGSIQGRDVGHCGVPMVAYAAAKAILVGGPAAVLPPPSVVPTP